MKYFDMMFYYLATFYKRFFKKRSGWEGQAWFVVGITQTMLLLDLYATFTINMGNSVHPIERFIFFSLGLSIIFYNYRKYDKKYLYYQKIFSNYQGFKKYLFVFLSFFTVIFAWCYMLILGYFFKY
jgi:hypothetical protein